MYKTTFNQLIHEELTISGEVQQEVLNVWKEIEICIPDIKTDDYTDYDYKTHNEVKYDGVKYGSYTKTIYIFNEKVTLFLNLYNFVSILIVVFINTTFFVLLFSYWHKLNQGGILIANYKEIVTKAVIAKGKKLFTSNHSINTINTPSTILGVWVINHNFNGIKNNDEIRINGSYDVNIWYSYDNDIKEACEKGRQAASFRVGCRCP